MRKLLSALILTGMIIFWDLSCYADNINFDIHSGYGILKFEEQEDFRGDDYDSDFSNTAVLLGIAGEYTFPQNNSLYAGVNADWTFGLRDREAWDRNGAEAQKNDMKLTTQFYELRAGYKNQNDNLHYRFFISGGWDGMRFDRDEFTWMGSPLDKTSTEKTSLWKIGGGAGMGTDINGWALEGGVSYSWYADGETEDSSLSGVIFDTDGYRVNLAGGLSHGISDNLSIYVGAEYLYQRLKGDTSDDDITWRSKLQLMVGLVNIGYTF